MRFIKSIPEVDPIKNELYLYDGWKQIKFAKGKCKLIIKSILITAVLAVFSFFWLKLIVGFSWEEIGITKDGFSIKVSVWWILLYFLLIFLHEFVHLLCIPNVFQSDCTYFGVSWYGGFAYSGEQMTRERYMFVSIMPCVLLSFLVPAILGPFGILNTPLKIMCIVNAMASGMDFFSCYEVLKVARKKDLIVNNGENMYYIQMNSYNSRR